MSDEIPGWLALALSEVASSPAPELVEDYPASVMDGDVCVLRPSEQPDGLGRLFLVTETGDGWCEGMLMGIETELATEVDGILSPAESGLAYESAAYTRFSGPVWITQIRRRSGAATESVLDQLVALSFSDEPDGVQLERGMPLQPEGIDPRYPALQAMSQELHRLTDDCRRSRHDVVSFIDPAIAEIDVLVAVASEPGLSSLLGSAEVQSEFIDRLLDAYPQLSPDVQRAVAPLLERSLLATAHIESVPVDPVFSGHRDSAGLSTVVLREAPGRRAMRVLSHHKCWTTRPGGAVRLAEQDTVVVFASINSTELQEAA